jgi:hypothetical protein
MNMKYRVVMRKYEIYVKYEVHTGFWWRSLKQRDHLGDPGVDGWVILKWICKKWEVGVWTGLG